MKKEKQNWMVENSDVVISDTKGDDNIICCAPSTKYTSYKNWNNNAKLIAAAPDLLEAVKDCVRYFEQHKNGGYNGEGKKWEKDSAYDKAFSAIKKATA